MRISKIELNPIIDCFYEDYYSINIFKKTKEEIDIFLVEENFVVDLNLNQDKLDLVKTQIQFSERFKFYLKIIDDLENLHEKNKLMYFNLSPEKIIYKKKLNEDDQKEIYELGLKNGGIHDFRVISKQINENDLKIAQNQVFYKHIKSITSDIYKEKYDIYSLVLIILKIEIRNLQIPNWRSESKENFEKYFQEYIMRIKMEVYNFMPAGS